MSRKLYIVPLLCFLGTACSKKNIGTEDRTLPIIQLISPNNNQVFTDGQTVNISGNITDDSKLVEIHAHIYNNGTGQLLIDINRFPDASVYSLNETFQAQAGIEYKIQILAIDKSANQGIVTVFVKAN